MPWNIGFTKQTHPSVKKISETMKRKHIDNFKKWRERMKLMGRIPSEYPIFKHSSNLAEYFGVMLGDGNISQFPRTERLIITGNANNPGFIAYYAQITQYLFGKKPTISRKKKENALRISLYQKEISTRLGIPVGNRRDINLTIPEWIWQNKEFTVAYLRGSFEAEGSFSIHLPTCTYNFQFKNYNQSFLGSVKKGLVLLGYHPEVRYNAVRLRKRKEALEFEKLIRFRTYSFAE